MKKWIGSLVVSTIAMTMMAVPTFAATVKTNAPQDVQTYAKGDGLTYVKNTLLTDPTGFGFASSDEVKNSVIGVGLPIYHLDPNKIFTSNSLLSVAKPTDSWEYVVYTSDGRPKTFFTIQKDNGQLQVVLLGGLADDFQVALNNYESQINGSDAQPILIEDQDIQYLVADVKNQEMAIPALSGMRAEALNHMDNSKLWSASDLIKNIQAYKHGGNVQNQTAPIASGTGSTVQTALDANSNNSNNSNTNNTGLIWTLAGALGLCGVGAYSFRKKSKN